MASDETDGFLAKVARLVRRPVSAWPDIDSGPSTGGLSDKQALKEAIERKKRNDFVRKREFDMLRAIRQREQGARDREARPSFFQSSQPARGDGREMTKRKIDEIEAQMSTHWWQQKPGDDRVPERLQAPRTGAEPAAPAHLQAQAYDTTSDWSGTVQGAQLPTQPAAEDMWPVVSRPARKRPASTEGPSSLPVTFGDDLGSQPGDTLPRSPGVDTSTPTGWAGLAQEICRTVPALEAAAVHFINHDLVQTERLLKDAVSQSAQGENRQLACSVLLDFYRVTGRQADFEAGRTAWGGEGSNVSAMAWRPLTEAAPAETAAADGWPVAWVCPGQLDARAVTSLQGYLAAPAAAHALDWSALGATNHDTAAQLLAVLERHAEGGGVLHWVGHQHLRRRLQASTPSGRRENHAVWWKLRLAVLRLLGHQDEFDLTALDYCVTYGVTPPDWSLTRCSSELHDRWPPEGDSVSPPPALPLGGQLRGDPSALLAALEAQAGGTEVLHIDCSGLQHVDLVAAGALLQWGKALQGRGRRAVLDRLHRLLAISLHVVGVDETLQLRVRVD